jgi:hypothetical protein
MTRLIWDALTLIFVTCGAGLMIGFAQALAQGVGQ